MTCQCSETRLSAIDARGNSYIAPVTSRCAAHRNARRVEDHDKACAVARFHEAARRLQRALPAPPPLLAFQHDHVKTANRCLLHEEPT